MEFELWRADRATSIIDLDARGCVVAAPTLTGWQEQLYPSHLVAGLGSAQVAGKHISELIPQLKGNAMIDGCRNGKQFDVAHQGDGAPITLQVRGSLAETRSFTGSLALARCATIVRIGRRGAGRLVAQARRRRRAHAHHDHARRPRQSQHPAGRARRGAHLRPP